MIEHVRTVGFKGFDIDEDVPEKALYIGPNKKGKTTRSMAIALALYGYIPFSNVGKRPGDILDSFGQSSLIVSVKIKGKEFARKFSRNKKGVVSQVLQYEGKRVAADNFAIMLSKAGSPKIADVAGFMKQSDAKMVDTLFEIYPDDTLSTIDSEIAEAKEDISRIEKKIDGAESTVVRLTKSKSEIEMPSGTIATVKDEIKSVDSKIADLEKQIKDAEIKETEAKAKEDTRKEIAESGGMSKEEAKKYIGGMSPGESHGGVAPDNDGDEYSESFLPMGLGNPIIPDDPLKVEEKPLKTEEDWNQYDLSGPSIDPKMVENDQLITKMKNQVNGIDIRPDLTDREFFRSPGQNMPVVDSIQKIIDALIGSGCSTCAALIVAKVELKKYKGVS